MKNRTLTGLALLTIWVSVTPALGQPTAERTTIGGVEYVKRTTRTETRDALLKAMGGAHVEWGRWWIVGPFDHPPGAADIKTPYPPEAELGAMNAGGKGPDLHAKMKAKDGTPTTWREYEDRQPIGGEAGLRLIDLNGFFNPAAPTTKAVAYLYRQVITQAPLEAPVSLGSDDGIRVWVNGELVLDFPAARPLDPEAHTLSLKLKAGMNHVLLKVSQGAGEWAAAFTPTFELDPVVESALDYRLDSDFPSDEGRYYRIVTVPAPRPVVAEIGGLAILPSPDNRPILTTRRGDVYIVGNAYELPPLKPAWSLFASGLQEPLGVAVREVEGVRSVLTAQRTELTRLIDGDHNDSAEAYETLCNQWQVSGNYHEYAFGPKFDRDGNAWVTLNLAHTGGETVMGATVPTRGWAVKISPDGTMHKVCDGLRSPDGIGMWSDGQMFYTDNQGDYVGTCKLSPLLQDSFHGHQASLKFRDGYGPNWKAEGKPVPTLTPPAVWYPYKKMGQSASDIALDSSAGKFGPFAGQFFVGEQTLAWVMRTSIEKVTADDGSTVYQGACYPFREGFESGVHRLAFAPDGSLFVGMTDRGWGSTGPKRFGLQRLVWSGQTPFELREMRIKPDGFELEFTKDVDKTTAGDPASYAMSSYTYEYHPDYGSNEMDTRKVEIKGVEVVGPRVVRIKTGQIRSGGMGYVHELSMPGVRSVATAAEKGQELVHRVAYYTVQRVPK